MDLLAELNSLRALDGKVPIKKWTGDEDQLKRAILQRRKVQTPQKTEQELIDEYLARGGDIKIGREASARGVRRQGGRRRIRTIQEHINKTKSRHDGTGRVIAREPQARAKVIPADCFTLAELARDKDTQAAYVRGLARKRPELSELNVKELGRWVFKLSDRDRVIAILWPRR